ncbi:MAG: hypothetical protein CME68_10900 [Halobacteriovoraceae bacterium]|nr:hypothetical protein [Halobacteriovoraceae bacterium]
MLNYIHDSISKKHRHLSSFPFTFRKLLLFLNILQYTSKTKTFETKSLCGPKKNFDSKKDYKTKDINPFVGPRKKSL